MIARAEHGHQGQGVQTVMKEKLERLFDELNEEHFGGRLSRPQIEIGSPMSSSNAFYFNTGRRVGLLITSETTSKGVRFARDTMLHEMVHHAIATLYRGDHRAHGRQFVAIANEIGGRCGLKSVAADTDAAICWPQSVRNETYYLASDDA